MFCLGFCQNHKRVLLPCKCNIHQQMLKKLELSPQLWWIGCSWALLWCSLHKNRRHRAHQNARASVLGTVLDFKSLLNPVVSPNVAAFLLKLCSGNASRPPEWLDERRKRWRSWCFRLKMRGATRSNTKTRWGSVNARTALPRNPTFTLILVQYVKHLASLSAGGQAEQPNAPAETSAWGGRGGGDPSQRLPQEAAEGAGWCHRDGGRHEPRSQHPEEQAEVRACLQSCLQ